MRTATMMRKMHGVKVKILRGDGKLCSCDQKLCSLEECAILSDLEQLSYRLCHNFSPSAG